MDNNEFKKVLFKVAFCTMACDGHIDDREIDELKVMDKKTTFFEAIDLSEELNHLRKEFKKKGAKVIELLFSELRETKLNPIQELLVLEVALRIINADEKHDDNEVKFIHFLRSKLEIHNETIIDRFGELDILFSNEYLNLSKTSVLENEFLDDFKLPNFEISFKTD